MQVTGKNNNLLVTGGMDKTVQIYDREKEQVLATLKGSTKKIAALVVMGGEEASAEDLPRLIAAATDKAVKLWSPSTKKAGSYVVAGTLTNHGGEVTGLDLHPSGTLLLSGALDGTWAIHDVQQSPKTLVTVSVADGLGISAVQWHPDGVILAAGLSDSSIKIFDAKTSACAASFAGHAAGPIRSLSFSENGYGLASVATQSNMIKLWDLRKLSNYHSLSLPDGYEAQLVRWDPSAQFLAVVGTDVRVWQNKAWDEPLLVFDANTAELSSLQFVSQGQEILVGGMDRTVTVLAEQKVEA